MSPRKRKIKRRACAIERTSSGLLRFRFRWKLPDGTPHRFTETTSLQDTPENRAVLDRQADLIGAAIRADSFDYLKTFPRGTRALYFLTVDAEGQPPKSDTASLTIRAYHARWMARIRGAGARPTRIRDSHVHFNRYVFDVLGDTRLDALTLNHLEDLRATLRNRGLGEKTIHNVIAGSLRAMFRDARIEGEDEGFAVAFPFDRMTWARRVVPGPDPFTAAERDKLLEYFRGKVWRVGRGFGGYVERPHFSYFAFVFTLFYTGMRPSEAVALRWGSLDWGTGSLRIERSRSLGYEGAPKTSAAVRIVRLTPSNLEILRQLTPLRIEPGTYMFTNTLGEPIEQRSFYRLFCDAQRVLEIRLRDLYATKDTYVSLALTAGVNLTWLSEQTGVAEGTLRRHYGRFVHSTPADAWELAKIDGEGRTGAVWPPVGHSRSKRRIPPRDFAGLKVEQKGFEPSTPTLRTWCSPS